MRCIVSDTAISAIILDIIAINTSYGVFDVTCVFVRFKLIIAANGFDSPLKSTSGFNSYTINDNNFKSQCIFNYFS